MPVAQHYMKAAQTLLCDLLSERQTHCIQQEF